MNYQKFFISLPSKIRYPNAIQGQAYCLSSYRNLIAMECVTSRDDGNAVDVGRDNINVNCVSAAATNTERRIREHQEEWEQATEEQGEKIKKRESSQLKFYPLGRLGEPEDVASMIVFLASDRAKHITGQVISVNGGYTMVG